MRAPRVRRGAVGVPAERPRGVRGNGPTTIEEARDNARPAGAAWGRGGPRGAPAWGSGQRPD